MSIDGTRHRLNTLTAKHTSVILQSVYTWSMGDHGSTCLQRPDKTVRWPSRQQRAASLLIVSLNVIWPFMWPFSGSFYRISSRIPSRPFLWPEFLWQHLLYSRLFDHFSFWWSACSYGRETPSKFTDSLSYSFTISRYRKHPAMCHSEPRMKKIPMVVLQLAP